MNVKQVAVHLRRPSGDDPGQATTAYYVVQGDVLVLTRANGTPVDPERFRHKLRPGDDPAAIAGVLGKQVRREALKITEEQERFYAPLDYGVSDFI
ncbi:hypothetical protein [Bradyrhizobium diazoefficiens]|uniref:hypothetical protein n=1 Tax=Bradyrhizobium diazoefficiens TaxID=1355477 RepID=UPI001B4F32C8|nr:hypothetical protein [Bradyrhizobium japonicum]